MFCLVREWGDLFDRNYREIELNIANYVLFEVLKLKENSQPQ